MNAYFNGLWSIGISLALAGCGALPDFPVSNARGSGPLEPETSRYTEKILAFDKQVQCPVSGEYTDTGGGFGLAAIATAAAPVLVNFAYSQLQVLVTKHKKNLNATRVILGAVRVPSSAQSAGCLAIIRGRTGSEIEEGVPASMGAMTISDLGTLGLTRYPDFYMEVRLIRESDNTLKVQPAFLHYAKTAAKRSGDGVKNLTVAMAFSDSPLKDASSVESASSMALFSFPETKIRSQFPEDLLSHDRRQLALSARGNTSINVTALINETADADIATEFLISLLGNDEFKKTVTDGATGAIVTLFGVDKKK